MKTIFGENTPKASTTMQTRSTVWIDHAGTITVDRARIKRTPPAFLRESANHRRQEFAKWWKRLNPPGTLA